MDTRDLLLLLIVAAAVGVVSTMFILRRERHEREVAARENPFAASTEGEKRCPNCGMGNLWTDTTCVACGEHLPG